DGLLDAPRRIARRDDQRSARVATCTDARLLHGRTDSTMRSLPFRPVPAVLLAAFAAFAPGAARATWMPQGTPVIVATGDQRRPAIAAGGAGGAFVVWADGPVDSARIGMQRLGDAGDPASGWVPSGLVVHPGAAGGPVAIADGAGGAYVAWPDSTNGLVHVNRYDAGGARIEGWPEDGVVYGADDDVMPRIEALDLDPIGGVVVSWRFFKRQCHGPPGPIPTLCHNHGPYVAVSRIDADGILSWTRERTQLEGQDLSQAISDGAAGAVFAWHDSYLGELKLLRYSSFGANAPGWPTQGVVLATYPGFAYGERVRLVDAPAGGSLVVWTGLHGGASAIFLHHVNGDGTFALDSAVVCLVPAPPELQGVVTDGAGGAIAAWKDARNGHAELYAIRWLADGSVAPGWNASGSLLAIAPGARGP